ncbi:hypothetical protein FACS1894195_0580 [Bacteroidia bacterium]|nr:hypothetical protein FACS1894195_0580 [Bacteroidia bacterium]
MKIEKLHKELEKIMQDYSDIEVVISGQIGDVTDVKVIKSDYSGITVVLLSSNF